VCNYRVVLKCYLGKTTATYCARTTFRVSQTVRSVFLSRRSRGAIEKSFLRIITLSGRGRARINTISRSTYGEEILREKGVATVCRHGRLCTWIGTGHAVRLFPHSIIVLRFYFIRRVFFFFTPDIRRYIVTSTACTSISTRKSSRPRFF